MSKKASNKSEGATKRTKAAKRGRPLKYDWPNAKVGEVVTRTLPENGNSHNLRASMFTSMKSWAKRNNKNWTISSSVDGNKVSVWRTK